MNRPTQSSVFLLKSNFIFPRLILIYRDAKQGLVCYVFVYDMFKSLFAKY